MKIVAAFIAWIALGGSALGEHCYLVKAMDALLLQRYAEQPAALGLESSGKLLKLYVNSGPKATWTMVMITPEGWACVIAVGTNWSFSEKEDAL
jgi:hypothetical protein